MTDAFQAICATPAHVWKLFRVLLPVREVIARWLSLRRPKRRKILQLA